jgi:hypothetical protein
MLPAARPSGGAVQCETAAERPAPANPGLELPMSTGEVDDAFPNAESAGVRRRIASGKHLVRHPHAPAFIVVGGVTQ